MKRLITGKVASAKPDKTIIVRVDIKKTHPLYRKQYSRNRRFMAHDEKNEAKEGDLVTIAESRPYSAKKHFVLDSIVEKAHIGFESTDAEADIPEEQRAKTHEQILAERAEAKAKAEADAAVNEPKPEPKQEKKAEPKKEEDGDSAGN